MQKCAVIRMVNALPHKGVASAFTKRTAHVPALFCRQCANVSRPSTGLRAALRRRGESFVQSALAWLPESRAHASPCSPRRALCSPSAGRPAEAWRRPRWWRATSRSPFPSCRTATLPWSLTSARRSWSCTTASTTTRTSTTTTTCWRSTRKRSRSRTPPPCLSSRAACTSTAEARLPSVHCAVLPRACAQVSHVARARWQSCQLDLAPHVEHPSRGALRSLRRMLHTAIAAAPLGGQHALYVLCGRRAQKTVSSRTCRPP